MSIDDLEHVASTETEPASAPFPFLRRSGLYALQLSWPAADATPSADTAPAASENGERPPADADTDVEAALVVEELRVDVDGLMPTMTVSGTRTLLFGGRITWIARVSWSAAQQGYTGAISYLDGNASLEPHTHVLVKLSGGPPFDGHDTPPTTLPHALATLTGAPGPAPGPAPGGTS